MKYPSFKIELHIMVLACIAPPHFFITLHHTTNKKNILQKKTRKPLRFHEGEKHR